MAISRACKGLLASDHINRVALKALHTRVFRPREPCLCRHLHCTAILASPEGLGTWPPEIHQLLPCFEDGFLSTKEQYTIALFSPYQESHFSTAIKHAMARQKAENTSTSVTRTRILPFGYIPITSRQLTHVSTPRAYGDFPVGTKDDLKRASLEGAGDPVDHFATKMSPWTEMAGEGNSSCLDKEKIGILKDNALSDMSRSPSPNYCYSTTKERRSRSPDFSQSYQICNDIDTESCKLLLGPILVHCNSFGNQLGKCLQYLQSA